MANGNYLSASSDSYSPLLAKSDTVGRREKFWITDAGSGDYGFRTLVHDNYVSMGANEADKPVQAFAQLLQGWRSSKSENKCKRNVRAIFPDGFLLN